MQSERISKKEKDSGSLNIRALKKIVTIMNRAKLTELNIEQDGFKIHLKKGGEPIFQSAPVIQSALSAATAAAPVAPAPVVEAPAEADANCYTIKSPMVGTFYRAASPESAPYIEVGAAVNENTVVCLVEAMKLMNEIKAEVKGKIKEILVENAQAIEYGQPLFLVERS